MSLNRVHAALLAAMIGLTGAACSQILGTLRPDLRDAEDNSQDRPTVGGTWSERGLLDDDPQQDSGGDPSDRYARLGHADRGPASAGYDAPRDSDSWITEEGAQANRRDMDRTGVNQSPGPNPQYRNGNRATKADFVDDGRSEGSLWASDGQTNYYFTKNKVRGVGDIVSVKIEPDLIRDLGIEVRRTLTPQEKDTEYALAKDRIRARAMGVPQSDSVAATSAAPQRSPADAQGGQQQQQPQDATPPRKINDADLPEPTLQDLNVAASLEVKPGDLMMGEIVQRYPNGNYKIQATKRIPYKNGAPRLVTLVGIAKGSDIGEDDTIASGKLYEYRIEAKPQ